MDQLKVVVQHRVVSQYDRQILVVYGELPQGDDDSPRLLVESLAVPVRVQLVQLLLNTVVLTHPDRVLSCQASPLAYPTVACKQWFQVTIDARKSHGRRIAFTSQLRRDHTRKTIVYSNLNSNYLLILLDNRKVIRLVKRFSLKAIHGPGQSCSGLPEKPEKQNHFLSHALYFLTCQEVFGLLMFNKRMKTRLTNTER